MDSKEWDKGYIIKDDCRVCHGKNLISYLRLGNMPLANALITEDKISKENTYPLDLMFCGDCSFSQINTVVEPEILFRNYVYRSSISNSFRKHCSDLADELNSGLLSKDDLVVDIASNDGCLLSPFKERHNRVLGVDPARNLAELANRNGIETIPEFWNEDLSKRLRDEYGAAKAITAFNVFAHVDDVHSFTEAVKNLLADDGYFIIEAPHLYNLIEKTEFDTVYHEHLSYLLVKPVKQLMEEHGLRLAKAKSFDIHGGSIRMYIEKDSSKDTSDGSTDEVMALEEKAGLYNIERYKALEKDVFGLRRDLTYKLLDLKFEGKSVSGFGASAKGNTLLNYCGIGNDIIDCIFDDTPEKQGKITPGVYIPIVNGNELYVRKPDYLLLLAWNFVDEIMQKTKKYAENGGKYIVPVPKLKII